MRELVGRGFLFDVRLGQNRSVMSFTFTQSGPHHYFYKMADSKIYLNVPFAQKDEAKALGARWYAVQKKWHAPADKDITLFAKWQTESGAVISPSTKTLPTKISSSFKFPLAKLWPCCLTASCLRCLLRDPYKIALI
jgi:hypothetical protein